MTSKYFSLLNVTASLSFAFDLTLLYGWFGVSAVSLAGVLQR